MTLKCQTRISSLLDAAMRLELCVCLCVYARALKPNLIGKLTQRMGLLHSFFCHQPMLQGPSVCLFKYCKNRTHRSSTCSLPGL